jgi:hypothetical protein
MGAEFNLGFFLATLRLYFGGNEQKSQRVCQDLSLALMALENVVAAFSVI